MIYKAKIMRHYARNLDEHLPNIVKWETPTRSRRFHHAVLLVSLLSEE